MLEDPGESPGKWPKGSSLHHPNNSATRQQFTCVLHSSWLYMIENGTDVTATIPYFEFCTYRYLYSLLFDRSNTSLKKRTLKVLFLEEYSVVLLFDKGNDIFDQKYLWVIVLNWIQLLDAENVAQCLRDLVRSGFNRWLIDHIFPGNNDIFSFFVVFSSRVWIQSLHPSV